MKNETNIMGIPVCDDASELLDQEAIAAQIQWIETGTVPVSYLQATVGASFSNRERPVTLSATNFEKKK